MLQACYEDFKVDGLITFGNVTRYLSDSYPDSGHAPDVKFWHILHHRGDPVSTTMEDLSNFKFFVTVHDVSNWRSNKVHRIIAGILKNV